MTKPNAAKLTMAVLAAVKGKKSAVKTMYPQTVYF